MKRFLSLVILFSLIAVFSAAVLAETELDGKYMTMKDSRGRIICQTSHRMVNGDQYLTSDNNLYQVVKVNKNTAVAKLVRKERINPGRLSGLKSYLAGLSEFLFSKVNDKGPIAIYHTHTDESYVRGDGVSSKKYRGGIFQVGETLTKSFEEKGIPVIHSKTPHDPHDAMAYDRSRRTAFDLLKKQPAAILDVHRDAVPAQEYQKTIGNQSVTKVQLVVGRENPNFQANNAFAKQIKYSVDRKYPGLIKGIFYGKGKYNQDLGPRTILLEFGSNTNRKFEAERSAQIFATAATDVLYGNAGRGIANRGGFRSLFWIVAAVIGAGGLFLILNKRGLRDIAKEFTGAIGEENPQNEQKNQTDPKNGEKP